MLFSLKVTDFVATQETLRVINLACGDCMDALALSKFMQILQKPFEYYGIDSSKLIAKQKQQLAGHPEIKLIAGDVKTEIHLLLANRPEFNFGILRHTNVSSPEYFAYLATEKLPLLINHAGLLLFTFSQQSEIITYQKLRLDQMYYQP